MISLSLFLRHPDRLGVALLQRFGVFLPDKLYLKWLFRLRMGYPLNLKEPKTFNEKLQWLKLYNRNPKYTTMVDKYAVKEYVANIIGKQYVIPTLGVWDNPEDIDWDILPDKFVLKTTHSGGSEGVVICRDKSNFNRQDAISKLKQSMKDDIYKTLREWPYKNVQKRVIAEEYLEDESEELKDYKVFNFNGEPRIIDIDYNRFQGHLRNLYTTEWQQIEATLGYPSDPERKFDKPKALGELLNICRRLSTNIPHVRTDFYIVNDKILFGELTFFHGSGFEKAEPEEFGKLLGDYLILPVMGGGISDQGQLLQGSGTHPDTATK